MIPAVEHGKRGRPRIRRLELAVFWLVALSIPAALLLHNRFPWVFWDSSEYLVRWRGLHPGVDRPIFYSLWLALFHPLRHGLDLAALAQVAVIAGAIRWLGTTIGGGHGLRISWALLLAFLASPALLHALTLMPDFAALAVAAALGVLALARTTRATLIAALIIAALSLMHFSLPPVALASAAIGFAIDRSPARSTRRFALGYLTLTALLLLGASWNWWLAGGEFRPRSASTVFLAARLQEAGVLADSLAEVTAATQRRDGGTDALVDELRAAPQELGWFLWGPSPLNRGGPAWRYEMAIYREVEAMWAPAVAQGLRHHPGPILRTGLENVRSMSAGEGFLGGFVPHREGSGVDRMLTAVWPDDAPRHLAGRQSAGETVPSLLAGPLEGWRRATPWLSGATVLLLLAGIPLAWRRSEIAPARLVVVLAATYGANAWICGLFSGASSRYLERLSCLPLWCLLLAAFALPDLRRRRPSGTDLPDSGGHRASPVDAFAAGPSGASPERADSVERGRFAAPAQPRMTPVMPSAEESP